MPREGPYGEGSLQLFVDADFEQHYFTMLERAELRDRLQRICLFDLASNNADRKSGHCLLGPDGACTPSTTASPSTWSPSSAR